MRRGICPRCNQRRMVQCASFLVDHVLPRIPYRQWVIVLPKWLRPVVRSQASVQSYVLRTFLKLLQSHLSGRLVHQL